MIQIVKFAPVWATDLRSHREKSMPMKLVKKTEQYSIYKRGDERYAVKDANKKPVNGEEKARILVAEDLVKVNLSAKPAIEASASAEPSDPAESPVAEEAGEETK
jgi:hypothetical protein